MEFEEILAKVVSIGRMSSEEAVEFSELVAQVHEDVDFVHEICVKLPESAFRELWETNANIVKLVIDQFVDHICVSRVELQLHRHYWRCLHPYLQSHSRNKSTGKNHSFACRSRSKS